MRTTFNISCMLIASSLLFTSAQVHAQSAKNPKKAAPKQVEKNEEPEYEMVPSKLLQETTFFDGKVSVIYPASFKQLPLDIAQARYPSNADRPKIILAPGDNYKINLALNLAPNPSGDRDSMVKFFRDVKESIRMQFPNDAEFMRNDVDSRTQSAYIEVIFPNSQGQKIYNLMYFYYLSGDFFFMNFSAPAEELNTWQKTAWSIKDSVKINSK